MKVLGHEVTLVGTIYVTILAILAIPAINAVISISGRSGGPQCLTAYHPDAAQSGSHGASELLTTRLTFTNNRQYTNLSAKYDHLWEEELLTESGGMVPDPTSQRETDGKTSGSPIAGIAMFHQLHCLSMIRTALKDSSERMPHLTHCLDYLRQSILCAADPTLEPEKFNKKTKEYFVDGIGVEHQCRNASLLYELANRQRA